MYGLRNLFNGHIFTVIQFNYWNWKKVITLQHFHARFSFSSDVVRCMQEEKQFRIIKWYCEQTFAVHIINSSASTFNFSNFHGSNNMLSKQKYFRLFISFYPVPDHELKIQSTFRLPTKYLVSISIYLRVTKLYSSTWICPNYSFSCVCILWN